VRGVDDELAALGVVGGGRLDRLDVRAVAGLGHREAARQLHRRDPAEVALVVLSRAEVKDGAAEQPELDPALDEQREIAERERLERGDRAADVVHAAELRRVAEPGAPVGGERSGPLGDEPPVLVGR
jgi:hypothetical protein